MSDETDAKKTLTASPWKTGKDHRKDYPARPEIPLTSP